MMLTQTLTCFLLSAISVSAQSLVTSTSGSCAANTGETCLGSRWGDCCSPKGFCGADVNYCGSGCQAGFGACYASSDRISLDGSCGVNSTTCLGSIFGNCCSKTSFCGNTTSYCSTGCQNAFGVCGDAAANATVLMTTAPASTASTARSSSTTLTSRLSTSTSSSATSASSASSLAVSSSSSSSSGNSPTSQVQAQPITESTGFKAGMAILAIALVAIVAASLWFLVRRRRSVQPHGSISERPRYYGTESKTPLKVELPASSVSEIGDTYVAELPASYSYPSSMVNKRAAAGYDGAYRGH